jgi:hypothetical protein
MQVARLSRAVEQLSLAGMQQRHSTDGARELFYRRAASRLGAALASRVYR